VLRHIIHTGIYRQGAIANIIQSIGRGQQEDLAAMNKLNPNSNDYWEDKRADMSKIKIPVYILGSYSTSLHTLGAVRGFEEISHQEKWYDSSIIGHKLPSD
jgi:predicted acyl esterase